MTFLADADVLSEPTKPKPHTGAVNWLRENEADLVVSAVTVGELRYGILRLPAGRKRKGLLDWFDAGVDRLTVVEFDSGVARVWADLLAGLHRKGRAMPIKDSLIAATAKRHGLVVATRNTADYKRAGVKLVDPFGR